MFHAIQSTIPGRYAVLDTVRQTVAADDLDELQAHTRAMRLTANRIYQAAAIYPTGSSCPRSLCSGPCRCKGEM